MSFKCTMKVTTPEEVEVTLSITMKLIDWRILREQLATEHPSWQLSAAIVNLIDEVKQTFQHQEGDAS